jgi:7-cyano-7-deazaguanine tRNA-ribosyltransferase
MFETRAKDAMGRVCYFSIKGIKLETPLLLPVINPNIDVLGAGEIKKIGFDAVITNSYIIFRNEALREEALKNSVKDLIGFDGVVMTDSGSYQLYQYGEVEIGPDEIVRFQEAIGSDIGVILDVPTPPDVGREGAKSDLKLTLQRAKNAVKLRNDMLLAGTVQGSTHFDLREESARAMAKLDFDVYPIGGVVPLLESYRFSELARIIIHSKKFIPPDKPVHLFGAGHPMMFALAVSLGCDIFDSAAYFLYARDNRYITPSGTLRLGEMHSLPCDCPVCSEYSPEELSRSPEKVKLLALHNLYVTSREIKCVKEAIWRGSLWELVENRCRAHPRLLDALRVLKEYPLETHEPLSKQSAFFYSGHESLHRPEVKRHLKKLLSLKVHAKTLVLLLNRPRKATKHSLGSNREYHVCWVSPVFGVIPSEVEEVYPLSQNVYPQEFEDSQLSMMMKIVKGYAKNFRSVLVGGDLGFLDIEAAPLEELGPERDTSLKMMVMGDYQFGVGAGAALFQGCKGTYSRTGRLRYIHCDEELVATVRASDGILVPNLNGAKRLHTLDFPRNRVVVNDDEVCEFIMEGRSVFSKFISNCDSEIVPGSEVIVVNKSDELVGWGRSLLDARELIAFKVGVGVKTRGGVK